MLDLAERDERAAFLDLLAESDVLVENFRTGALDRLGLDGDTIDRVNPGLVWCSVTGYGSSGERAGYPAYDSVIQAASGLMNLTGTAQSGPLKAGASIVDYTTGLNAALGVVSALMLRERGRTEGSRVEVSMLDTALAMMQSTVSGVLNGAETLRPRGNAASSGNLLSRDYPTQDGMVCIAVNEPHQLRALLSSLGIAVGQQGTPTVDSDLLVQVASRVARYTSNDLDGLLNRAGVPCAPVQGLDEAIGTAATADPKLIQKGCSGDLRYMMLPFRLNDDRGVVELDPAAPAS
jgi:crotonobetainyl-CoA:carnitine CoA-transferase CaiB-like acyl-CoA transferase